MTVCMCECEAERDGDEREREKTSSRDVSPSINRQKSLSTWVRPHPATSPAKPRHESTLAGCLSCALVLRGIAEIKHFLQTTGSRLEQQQRRHLDALERAQGVTV